MADNKVMTSTKGIPSFKGKFTTPNLGKINADIEDFFKGIKEDSKGFKTAMEEEARNLSKSINAYCDEHK